MNPLVVSLHQEINTNLKIKQYGFSRKKIPKHYS